MQMIQVTKNGHNHEFTPESWDRMGSGNTRMGWILLSESMTPPEVEILKQKSAPVEEIKKKAVVSAEVPIDEPVEELKVKRAYKKK